MATASEEFFVRFKYWFVSGGMMTRMAWGMTTKRRIRSGFSLPPRDRLQAGAHDLGNECSGVCAKPDQQRHQFRQNLDAAADIEAALLGIGKVDGKSGGNQSQS